jgi:hypothetical protein
MKILALPITPLLCAEVGRFSHFLRLDSFQIGIGN